MFKSASFPSSEQVIQMRFRHTFVEERMPFTYQVRMFGLIGSRRPVPRRMMYDSGDVSGGNELDVCRVKVQDEDLVEVEVTQTTLFATWRIEMFCSQCSPPNPLP